jgi:cell division protein FtsB
MKKTVRDRIATVAEAFSTLMASPIRRRILIIGGAVICVFSFLLFSNKGVLRRVQLSRARASAERLRDAERRQCDSLAASRVALESNLFMIERIARERDGLSAPGETIYRYYQPMEPKR